MTLGDGQRVLKSTNMKTWKEVKLPSSILKIFNDEEDGYFYYWFDVYGDGMKLGESSNAVLLKGVDFEQKKNVVYKTVDFKTFTLVSKNTGPSYSLHHITDVEKIPNQNRGITISKKNSTLTIKTGKGLTKSYTTLKTIKNVQEYRYRIWSDGKKNGKANLMVFVLHIMILQDE